MKIINAQISDEEPDEVVICFDDPGAPKMKLRLNESITLDGVTFYYKGIKNGAAEFSISPIDAEKVKNSYNNILKEPIDESRVQVPHQWICDAKAIHGSTCDYTHAIYSGRTTNFNEKTVLIKCKKHGQIEVGFSSHLGIYVLTGKREFTPKGCPRCRIPTHEYDPPPRNLPLISLIDNVSEWYDHYKLEFSCDRIPVDWTLLAGFRVAGGQYYRDETQAFIRSYPYYLLLERDAKNIHDINAIRVIGVNASEKRYFIGHIPADYAKRIVENGVLGSIRPVLHLAQISRSGFAFIEMGIYGGCDLLRLVEDPNRLKMLEDQEEQRKLLEEKWEEDRRQREIREAPLTNARELEHAKEYSQAIKIYIDWLRHDPRSEVYDRISVCYGRIGDYEALVNILEEYVKKRDLASHPCRKALLDRLDRARTKIGMPKLDEHYRNRLLQQRSSEPYV